MAVREAFAADRDASTAAGTQLAGWLREVVAELDPTVLGVYWPHRSEFNAATVFATERDAPAGRWPLALPAALRAPPRLEYRAWEGLPPVARDEHGIPTSDGPAVQPDVVLVPCVGYTASGHRLGYGGGYFDRWLAAHPGVTAVGVAWAASRIEAADFAAAAHDVPLTLIVTEHGVV